MVTNDKWDNKGQYTKKRIMLYEQIFGEGYISAGGHRMTRQMCLPLQNLQKDVRVLDIGSGLGGPAFFLESQYGCNITGVDLCSDIFNIAIERAALKGSKVKFMCGDILDMEFGLKAFDVIMSRDTLLHLPENKKRELFAKCIQWLDNHGEIIIGDYCRRPRGEEICASFRAYIVDRGYDLHAPFEYGKLLEDAGFKEVEVKDVSIDFLEMLETELGRFQKDSHEITKNFTKDNYADIEKSWIAKIEWVRSGDMRKGILFGRQG